MPVIVEKLRQLHVKDSSSLENVHSVSAASGLIVLHDRFYLAVDDRFSLAVFSRNMELPGQLIPLQSGDLPEDKEERKKRKPDLESLCHLNAQLNPPHGAILAIPSGSTENRCTGFLIPFKENGELETSVRPVNFRGLYKNLMERIPELNIEGSVMVNGIWKLFQRGNGPSQFNAMINLKLQSALIEILSEKAVSAQNILAINKVDLGSVAGIPYAWTDGACDSSGQVWFLGVAEGVLSTYEDGCYQGAVLGCLNAQDEVIWMDQLLCPEKPEGLSLTQVKARLGFYLVTDADDANTAAGLYQGQLPTIMSLKTRV